MANRRLILKFIVNKLRPVLYLIMCIFFDRRYITGKHFDSGLAGYAWGLSAIWTRNILRLAPPLPFPASFLTRISDYRNLDFHPDDLNNMQSPGSYFQNFYGKITIGRGTYIAPNVGIITVNHDPSDLDRHLSAKDVVLGESCWIGMNSVLLPGVHLGSHTIVGAGSIVTKSFPEGCVVIAGNPARALRENISAMGDH